MSGTKMMYLLKQSLKTPNGKTIRIYTPSTGGNFVPFADLKQPLGYSDSTNLKLIVASKKALDESNISLILGTLLQCRIDFSLSN